MVAGRRVSNPGDTMTLELHDLSRATSTLPDGLDRICVDVLKSSPGSDEGLPAVSESWQM